jgi:hypothetical protein
MKRLETWILKSKGRIYAQGTDYYTEECISCQSRYD